MKHFLKLIAPLFTAFGVFAYALTIQPVHAAPNSLWLQPGNSSYSTGQTFTVTVYGSAGANAGAPNTNVTVKYPGNLLAVTNVSKGTGIPQATLTHNTQAQTIALTHSFLGYSSGLTDAPLFTITFKANAPGNALVDFTSTFLRGHTVGKSASTYSIVNPSCPTGQIGTPPNCATPPPPPAPTPTPAPSPVRPTPAPAPKPSPSPSPIQPPNTSVPTAPQEIGPTEQAPSEEFSITSYDVASSYNTATFSWKTNDKATGLITYGTSANKLDNQIEALPEDDGSTFSVNIPKLQLGTTYHYAIIAKNTSDISVVKKGTFTTKAYPVLLRVSSDGQAVDGAKVTLQNYDSNYKTNDKGETTLSLKPGTYTAQITKENLSESQTFNVKQLPIPKDKSPDTQVIEVKILSAVSSAGSPNFLSFIIAGLIALLIAAAAIGFVVWRRRRLAQDDIGYQSILEPGIDSPYNTSDAMPGAVETYSQPQTYSLTGSSTSPPAYTPQTSFAIPITDPLYQIAPPVIDSNEPEDMWSTSSDTPTSPTPYADAASQSQIPYSYVQQPTTPTEVLPFEDEPVRYDSLPAPLQPSETLISNENEAVQRDTGTPTTPVAEGELKTHEAEYEYNEDNSMTIHHTT